MPLPAYILDTNHFSYWWSTSLAGLNQGQAAMIYVQGTLQEGLLKSTQLKVSQELWNNAGAIFYPPKPINEPQLKQSHPLERDCWAKAG